MMTRFQNIFFCGIALLGFMVQSQAQDVNRRVEFGVGYSGYIYFGDLTTNNFGSYETYQSGFQIHGSFILSPSLMVRTNFTKGSLKGDDAIYQKPAFRQQRNFNFSTPVTEIAALLVWNPFKSNAYNGGFSPYVMAGAGVGFLKVKKDHSNFNPGYFLNGPALVQLIANDDAHGTPSTIPVVPVGAGVRYGFSSSLSVYVESAYRFIFTDYLDGFSQSANPKGDDHYQTISAGIIFRPGGSLGGGGGGKKGKFGCPSVSY
ncbi:MAG: DUF6089 family protein [Chitinophagaceae bacterium]